MEKKSFSRAIADYFGKLPGQSLPEFMAELKALTPADREYFKREFRVIGIEIEG